MSDDETNQPNFPRRIFLSQCAKITAGISLLGYSTLSLAQTTDSWENYSYCLYRCVLPCSWKPACPGCRSDEPYDQLSTCTVRICVVAKSLPSCAHCEELATCNKSLWVNYPGQRTFALNKQKQWNLITSSKKPIASTPDFLISFSSENHVVSINNQKQQKVDYQLIDLNGKIIRKGNFSELDFQIDLSEITSGNYVLCILQNNQVKYSSKIYK